MVREHLITEPLRSFTPIKLENGDLRMAIAVANQKAYNSYGEEATLNENFLSKDYMSWQDGLVSMNHEDNNDLLGGATLYDPEYDAEKKLVICSFANLPDRAVDLINSPFYEGLSQECTPLEWAEDSSNSVIRGHGTGVTIVTYPYTPAAQQSCGVGVRPTDSKLEPKQLAAILKSKYPDKKIVSQTIEKPLGVEKIPEIEPIERFDSTALVSRMNALESTIKAKDDKIATLESKLQEQIAGETARTQTLVNAALESFRTEVRAATERDGAVAELKSIMSEENATAYLSTNPTLDQIKSITGILRATAATGVGSFQPHTTEREVKPKYSSTYKMEANPDGTWKIGD